jgi:hypothetical protein
MNNYEPTLDEKIKIATAKEAEFSEVKPETKKSNVPAVLQDFQLYRHELLQGTNNEKIKKIATELELDKQLGLKHQCELTAETALKNDIDSLTSSNDYIQVSKQLLEKLFSIGQLKGMCVWHTIKSFIKGIIRDAKKPLIVYTFVIVALYPMCVWTGMVASRPCVAGNVFCGILLIIGWLAMICGVVYGIWDLIENVKIRYDKLEVVLDMKHLSHVDVKIPYGAKLKVLEAKETGIFKEFVYASPKFNVETKEWQNTIHLNLNIHPAILGVTQDDRMFMIVYWDVKKDKERIIKQINQFKKFKIEG